MDLSIEHRLTEVEGKAERNTGRIKKLESEHEALNNLATSVALMAERQAVMNKSVATLTTKVDALENKPGENWDKLVTAALGAVAGAFMAWLLSGAPGV